MSSWAFFASFWIALPLPAGGKDLLETSIGMEGVYYLRYSGPALEAKPVDEKAPLLLRIADIVEDGGSLIYELRYVGLKAGIHDLRGYLRRVDGQSLAGHPFQEPLEVRVKELLPPDHSGALEKLAEPARPRLWRYRFWIGAAILLWFLPVGWWILRWILRPRPKIRVEAGAGPTLADQLRPLVEAAMEGRLSTEGKARLELLLIAHWRDRLDLRGSTLEALRRMRAHHEAGELLRQLEGWLHRPPGKVEVDVRALLDPYQGKEQVDLTVKAGSEAPS